MNYNEYNFFRTDENINMVHQNECVLEMETGEYMFEHDGNNVLLGTRIDEEEKQNIIAHLNK